MQNLNIFWFRRDLRLEDNAALFKALQQQKPVLPIFIFDKNILDKLENKNDQRVIFIYNALQNINNQLNKIDASVKIFIDKPIEVFKKLIQQYKIESVFTNHDYEPYANKRDNSIKELLSENGIEFQSFKDQVIFEKDEILKADGKPYTIFTPYSKKWKAKLNPDYYKSYPTEKYFSNFYKDEKFDFPKYETTGFEYSNIKFPSKKVQEDIVKNYAQNRDFPGIESTSRLSVHLRFGTISIRKLVQQILTLSEVYLNELIWRDFYHTILHHFPKVTNAAFKPKYDKIVWRFNDAEFKSWCEGKTGYPIVDAGMRQLNETGFMHNRVRMVTASFLTKHLLHDWRLGEAYFAQKLLDFDLAANNGGWQWSAGTGCDAAPYFRIFNPESQMKKFDKDWKYIRKWVPEIDDPFKYPKPIVEHKFARQRALDTYKKYLNPEV